LPDNLLKNVALSERAANSTRFRQPVKKFFNIFKPNKPFKNSPFSTPSNSLTVSVGRGAHSTANHNSVNAFFAIFSGYFQIIRNNLSRTAH